jgi:hypothetical protein
VYIHVLSRTTSCHSCHRCQGPQGISGFYNECNRSPATVGCTLNTTQPRITRALTPTHRMPSRARASLGIYSVYLRFLHCPLCCHASSLRLAVWDHSALTTLNSHVKISSGTLKGVIWSATNYMSFVRKHTLSEISPKGHCRAAHVPGAIPSTSITDTSMDTGAITPANIFCSPPIMRPSCTSRADHLRLRPALTCSLVMRPVSALHRVGSEL